MSKLYVKTLLLACLSAIPALHAVSLQAADKPESKMADGPQSEGLRKAMLRGAALVAKAERSLNEVLSPGSADESTQLEIATIRLKDKDVSLDVELGQITYLPPDSTSPDDEGAIEMLAANGRIYRFELGTAEYGPQLVAMLARLARRSALTVLLPPPYRISDSRDYHGLGAVQMRFEKSPAHSLLALFMAYRKRPDAVLKFPSTTCRQLFAHRW